MESRDLALIRFVTRHQDELRGLHTAAFGLWMTGVLGTSYFVPSQGGAKLAAWIVIMTVPNILHDLASRWYAARIGRVGPERRFLRPRLPWALFLSAFAFDVTGITPIAGRSAILLLLGAYSLWVAVRDFPFRAYHLAVLVVIAAAPPAGDFSLKSTMFMPQYALAGMWFVASGLADHYLLVTSMRCIGGTMRRQAVPDPSPDSAP